MIKFFQPDRIKILCTAIITSILLFLIYRYVSSINHIIGACRDGTICPDYRIIALKYVLIYAIPTLLICYIIVCTFSYLYMAMTHR